MGELLLHAAEIYTEDGVLKNAALLIRDGKIAAINPVTAAPTLDLGMLRLAPAYRGAQQKELLRGVDREVVVDGGVARTADTGSLAGSTMPLSRALKHLHEDCGVALADAIRAASLNPARAIGIDATTGSIAPGKQADLIAFDADLTVRFVMIDGEIKKRG